MASSVLNIIAIVFVAGGLFAILGVHVVFAHAAAAALLTVTEVVLIGMLVVVVTMNFELRSWLAKVANGPAVGQAVGPPVVQGIPA